MKLYIKYMVSIRCKMMVQAELERLGLPYTKIELGEVELKESISAEKMKALDKALRKSGLEVMDDKRAILIERIKSIIIEMIHYSDDELKINFSDFLAEKLQYSYAYLSSLFTEVQGTTIEHFVLIHKIEKVKELLVYNELNLTDIAFKLNYSSVAHLSNQFKKITGLTPSHFKELKEKRRSNLEDL